MQWKWLFFWANQNFSIRHHAEKQNKKLNVRRVLLNWKISKNRGICKHYNKKLFVRNYFWKCSEVVHLKINFVINDMEVYLVKFFTLNIHEATGLFDLEKSLILLRIFNFFLRNLVVSFTSSSKCWEAWNMAT